MDDATARLADLKQKVLEFRNKRGWRNEDPKDMALSLILEASELLEIFQWKTGEEVEKEARLYGSICDELADVLWWVVILAQRLNIDIARAFELKMQKIDKKYPVELFSEEKSQEEKWRAYYRIKARTRGGHPLAEDETGEKS